jgi:hypothetical protein
MDASGSYGDTVAMNLSVTGLDKVAGVEIHLVYPSKYLEFVALMSNVCSDATINISGNNIHFVWEDLDNLLSLPDGEAVLVLSFVVASDRSDTLSVSLSKAHVASHEGKDVAVEIQNGEVIVMPDESNGNGMIPADFMLGDNFPNPFNSSTVINYALIERSHVAIDIFDILGRKIENLVFEGKPAGYHQVTWNAANMPSGVYFYRIKAGDFSDTKKMMFLK